MSLPSKKEFKKQVNFIEELISRLKEDMNNSLDYFNDQNYYFVPNRTRMQNDIIRIRRELNTLSKMLDPYN